MLWVSFRGIWIGVAGRGGATHTVQYLGCQACGAQYEFSNGLGGVDDAASDALEVRWEVFKGVVLERGRGKIVRGGI